MHVKKILKIITDILMFADFIFLMSHEVVRNLSAHGIYGSATFRFPKSGWIKYVVCIVLKPENFAYCHKRGIRFSS